AEAALVTGAQRCALRLRRRTLRSMRDRSEERAVEEIVEYRILGPVEALADGRTVDLGGPLERALLGRLLVAEGRAVSLPQLVEDLWEGEPPESANVSVRVRISRLRKALASGGAGDAVQTAPAGYRLQLRESDCLDAHDFQARVA